MRDTQFYQGKCQVAVGQADGQLSRKASTPSRKKKKKIVLQVVAGGDVILLESSQGKTWGSLAWYACSELDLFQIYLLILMIVAT